MVENQALQIDGAEAFYAAATALLSERLDVEAVDAWIQKRTKGRNIGQVHDGEERGTFPESPRAAEELPPLDASAVLKSKRQIFVGPSARQVILQEFEGRVVAISHKEGIFTAYLTDVTATALEDSEDVDFLIEDISEPDLALFEEGAIFRWLIGYRYDGTTKERFSKLVFRRMPAWTKQQLEQIWKKAEERAKALR